MIPGRSSVRFVCAGRRPAWSETNVPAALICRWQQMLSSRVVGCRPMATVSPDSLPCFPAWWVPTTIFPEHPASPSGLKTPERSRMAEQTPSKPGFPNMSNVAAVTCASDGFTDTGLAQQSWPADACRYSRLPSPRCLHQAFQPYPPCPKWRITETADCGLHPFAPFLIPSPSIRAFGPRSNDLCIAKDDGHRYPSNRGKDPNVT